MFPLIGGLGTLPSVLLGLLALAAVLLVGRALMKVAWKIVIAAVVVVGVLWILGMAAPELGLV